MSTEGVRKQQVKRVSVRNKKVEEVVTEPIEVPREVTKQKRTKKAQSPSADLQVEVAKVEVVDLVPATSEVQEDLVPSSEGKKLSRKKKTYEQLISEINKLNQLVEDYSTEHKDAKVPGLNGLLKGLEKGLKKTKFHAQKIGKSKGNSSGSNNVQSGFQKPVRISEEVASFTGWDVSEPRARVEVTNFVCEYIKRNKLQSPNDKRIILADAKLSQLLDYESSKDGDLTYATIQKLLAKHYTSLNAVVE